MYLTWQKQNELWDKLYVAYLYYKTLWYELDRGRTSSLKLTSISDSKVYKTWMQLNCAPLHYVIDTLILSGIWRVTYVTEW